MNTESEFVAHEPCNNCGSSDANSRYSDGTQIKRSRPCVCFACQTYTPAEGDNYTPRMNNERVTIPRIKPSSSTSEESAKQQTAFYRIYRYGNTLRFPYYTDDGRLAGFKIKTKHKRLPLRRRRIYHQHYLVNTYFQVLVNELLSLRAN